jgi:hypothetical protein
MRNRRDARLGRVFVVVMVARHSNKLPAIRFNGGVYKSVSHLGDARERQGISFAQKANGA